MSRSLAAVDFEDGLRLFLIFDHTVGLARRPLFTSAETAWEWYEAGALEFAEPASALLSELPVLLTSDLHNEGDPSWQFESRASREVLWLTGPRNSEETRDERDDEAPFGWGFNPVESPLTNHGKHDDRKPGNTLPALRIRPRAGQPLKGPLVPEMQKWHEDELIEETTLADFRAEQIGVNDAARLLGVRTAELKAAIREGKLIRGVEPPKLRHRGGSDGSGGWVFTAGDVMDVAEILNTGNSR